MKNANHREGDDDLIKNLATNMESNFNIYIFVHECCDLITVYSEKYLGTVQLSTSTLQ